MTFVTGEPADASAEAGHSGLVRLRLDLAYDGGSFHGWARQPGLRTVQGDLETALRLALRIDTAVPVRAAVAGRTDAGVHATGQVAHADVPETSWRGALEGSRRVSRSTHADTPASAGDVVARRMNGLLSDELRVNAVRRAPDGFDARWSAQWREYCYLVTDGWVATDPRQRGFVVQVRDRLDVGAMQAAASSLVGEHDFAAFCRPRAGASSVRTLHELRCGRLGGRRDQADIGSVVRDHWSADNVRGAGPPVAGSGLIEFRVRADAFCHSMVRSLVGALLAVGSGRWPIEHPRVMLASGRREQAVPVAPAHGLTLVRVDYPPDERLAAQAVRAKRWRGTAGFGTPETAPVP